LHHHYIIHLVFECALLALTATGAGFFIRNHPPTMRGIWMGVNFWSGGRMRPYFLLHEGYLGALGAFLSGELMPDRTADRLVASPAPAPSLSTSSWLSLLKSLSFRKCALPHIRLPRS
jgi:hypothetical protein